MWYGHAKKKVFNLEDLTLKSFSGKEPGHLKFLMASWNNHLCNFSTMQVIFFVCASVAQAIKFLHNICDGSDGICYLKAQEQ